MKQISHILVPTDFSGFSNRAFRFACALAEKASARVTLFHVVEPPYNFATAVKGMIDMMEENALRRMKLMIEESDTNIEFDTQIRHGRTSREILGCIERENVDLVVMGSRGQSALTRAVLGSVSEAIAHELPIPLFLIPETDGQPEISSFVFATDFRPDDTNHYMYASSIADFFDAPISIVHMSPDDNFDEKVRHIGFTEILRDETGDDSLSIELVKGDNLLHGIAEYVHRQENSALVFNRYKRTVLQKLFKKDHTDEMVVYADLPLLIIPSGSLNE